MKTGFRKWKLSTSTSPSNRHLDHYHALIKPHNISDPDEATKQETKQIANQKERVAKSSSNSKMQVAKQASDILDCLSLDL